VIGLICDGNRLEGTFHFRLTLLKQDDNHRSQNLIPWRLIKESMVSLPKKLFALKRTMVLSEPTERDL
jgi:hypothetical protein